MGVYHSHTLRQTLNSRRANFRELHSDLLVTYWQPYEKDLPASVANRLTLGSTATRPDINLRADESCCPVTGDMQRLGPEGVPALEEVGETDELAVTARTRRLSV